MTPSIVEIVVKSSVIVAAAAVGAGFMRRRGSATSRHFIWTLAVVGLLLLPVASAVLPALNFPVRRSMPSLPAMRESAAVATESTALGESAVIAAPQKAPSVASISWI